MTDQIIFSDHALQRMSQRGVEQTAVRRAVKFCPQIHKEGAIFIFIGKKEISRFGFEEKLNGLTIVFMKKFSNFVIKTVFKNKNGKHYVKKKLKENIRK
ncbi:DUF4258 domain-containing protein [bacterium]|nr:DUF4258 domain-containing protein [bacterium]